MKRNAYSLILMDDVVAAVDRLAAQQGTSRSNLINQILAEHVCCTCLLYTSPSPRDRTRSRMPSSA